MNVILNRMSLNLEIKIRNMLQLPATTVARLFQAVG